MTRCLLFQWQKLPGQPMVFSDRVLTPQARALIVGLPPIAYVWTRPTAVRVECAGQIEHLPIVDFTRNIQWGLLGLGVVMALAFVITDLTSFTRRSSGEKAGRKDNVS